MAKNVIIEFLLRNSIVTKNVTIEFLHRNPIMTRNIIIEFLVGNFASIYSLFSDGDDQVLVLYVVCLFDEAVFAGRSVC